jgi:pSer/pThr/pTyr-binding forkhead associated (FHA) protein
MRPKLVLVAGKADKAEIRLRLPTIVGRTGDAGLMIAHKTVSRRHCELFERYGMLYVRDTGSRNGTLVDDAPIKEAMVKPGHTLTIGPLTFRSDYEPADSFIRSDDADSPDDTDAGVTADSTNAADNGMGDEATADITATKVTAAAAIAQAVNVSETPPSGELEFEDFGSEDLGELGLPPLVDAVADDQNGHIEKEALLADAAESADDLMALDEDEFAMAFESEELPAPTAEVAEAAPVPDALSDMESDDDILSFDMTDEPAALPAEADADLASLLADDDAGFEVSGAAESAPLLDEPEDELGFTLEDLEDSPPLPAVEEAGESEEEAGDMLSFEVAEPTPPTNHAKQTGGDKGAKVSLEEEKSSGENSDMSGFMKELGL